MIAIERLQQQFRAECDMEQRRPGLWQLFVPIYHEDGDMVDVYLQELGDGQVRVSDGAMSLMRLSYTYNVHTAARERILQRMLSENQVGMTEGEIYVLVSRDDVYSGVMKLVQVEHKIAAMELFQREAIRSLFYELLDEFVMESLERYNPTLHYLPVPDRDELEVDYKLTAGSRDVFLFGVRDTSKSRVVTISALEFQRQHLPHRSLVVHEDFAQIPRKDQSRLMSAVDKQFPSLGDFRSHAVEYLEREAA